MKNYPLIVGTKIYYTGDMANQSAQGRIVKVYPPDRYCCGGSYDIEYEDDRRMTRRITPASFAPGPGRRFWPLGEWNAKRETEMKKFYAVKENNDT